MARYSRRPDPRGRAASSYESSPPASASGEDDVHKLIMLLPTVRGTPLANAVWADLFMHCWTTAEWPHIESLIRRVQAMSDAGMLSAGERFFLIARLTDAARSSRATVNPRFVALDQEIEDFERAHGLAEGEYWRIDQAPPEYAALNAQWDALGKAERIHWLEELGEPDMARLLRDNEDAFEARCSESGRGLFAPLDEDGRS